MTTHGTARIAHLWYEVMWSEPDPNDAPEWVHIHKQAFEQIKHEIKSFRSIFPDLKYEIVETAALPDRVWIRYKARGTQQGSAWNFPPTGKIVEFEGATILYIQSGKVVNRRGAFSFYDILTDPKLVAPLWELKYHLTWQP